MKIFTRVLLSMAVVFGLSACSIEHIIDQDYPEYLSKNTDSSNLPKTNEASEYMLTPATQQNRYEFRAFVTGYANLWVVNFGKMLDDTLASADVQKSFGGLQKIESTSTTSKNTLVFDLQQYTFEDFGAHITIKISLLKSGNVAFSKTYTQDGKSQGGKMFWGGAFGQKNAVQQSTKIALDEILRQLINDLNALNK